jgi:hypothetical protein
MKNWSEVDDATLRKHFVDEEKSYREISFLYEDATIGKVSGRCRKLGLRRGTSPMIGTKRKGRGGPVIPPKYKTVPELLAEAEANIARAPGVEIIGVTQDYTILSKLPEPKPKPKRAKVAAMSVVAMRQAARPADPKRYEFQIEDLKTHHCRWPQGDPGKAGFGFCGDRREGDSPYCGDHRKIATAKSYKG